MAEIFKKIKNLISNKNTSAEEEPFNFDFTIPQEPQIDAEGLTPAQRKRREDFYASIKEGHELPTEFEHLTKETAKEDLHRHISEKLGMFSSDEDAFEAIAREKERQRQELEASASRSRRRKRREEQKLAEAEMAPVYVEDAVIAKFEEPDPDITPSPEPEQAPLVTSEEIKASLPSYADMDVTLTPLEGQIAIRDINEAIRKAKEEEEQSTAEPQPDITEVPFAEAIAKEELPGDKAFAVIIKTAKHVAKAVVAAATKVKLALIAGSKSVLALIKKKSPEKAAVISEKISLKREAIATKNIKGKKAALVIRLIAIKDALVAKEQTVSDKLAHLVTRFDKKQDDNAEKAEIAAKKGHVKLHRFRHWLDLNKNVLLMGFTGVVALVLIVITGINWATAYEYSYNGKTLGMVKDQEDVVKILDIVSEQLSKEHDAEVFIDPEEDITFTRVWNFTGKTDSKAEVLRAMTYMQDMSVVGYGLYVEGTLFATLESEDAAKAILEEVKTMYAPVSDTVKYEDIDFAENIEILPVDTKLGLLYSHDDVLYKILTGSEEQRVHIVQPGDTFSGIASAYGLSQADLQASNPTVNPSRLSIGQEIILTQAVPLLTVQTVEVSTYVEYLPYSTEYQDNPNIYEGETTTIKAGVSGEREVTAKIVRNNGYEVAKLELNSVITKEATSAIVARGTKPLPPKKGTGSFIYPVSGYRLTSTFGQRWGRMHYGVDLACPTGTKIRASDGGTVIFSGYSGSYGYVVKIDHGGGYVTVYAHCSKLHVKVGDAVYQGQHIANVGSTGRSTGPHCHFEVQYLGVQKNPLNYL